MLFFIALVVGLFLFALGCCVGDYHAWSKELERQRVERLKHLRQVVRKERAKALIREVIAEDANKISQAVKDHFKQ